jgi:aerobic carbon-monoxide dehydrogenase medium subunit
MIPPEFDYVAPESIDAALAALRDGGEDAKLLAGGHSLLPLMKLRLAAPTLLVDLRRIGELTGVDPQRFSGQVELLTIARLFESSPG